jgi:hypothetical protein
MKQGLIRLVLANPPPTTQPLVNALQGEEEDAPEEEDDAP